MFNWFKKKKREYVKRNYIIAELKIKDNGPDTDVSVIHASEEFVKELFDKAIKDPTNAQVRLALVLKEHINQKAWDKIK